ncbi:CxxH/CxxC protein (TIGR04129 family) [Anoxybacillus tepidamans]|uniref:CxxH/CxxC protein (TIGR04129 family) n=1 Tax=Anoxybacteroides tepidamans TaxID=265948 RepID=A0A7W8IP50_9BACL|nr:CxxH/CxxC protein [Anoxybacillus tepidamans]MBB5324100.1 CxxH/CxxC protein (TIGR04129 family) [Anoxybacillus tepidamans]
MIACCKEHIELAIDVYVDKTEQAPEFSRISVDNKEEVCKFCSKRAEYIVGNERF